MTSAANQHIMIDAEVLQANVRALSDAADVFRSAQSNVSDGVGFQAFGAMCGPLLGPAISAVADVSRTTLETAGELSSMTSSALRSFVGDFTAIEDDAVKAFRAIEGLVS